MYKPTLQHYYYPPLSITAIITAVTGPISVPMTATYHGENCHDRTESWNYTSGIDSLESIPGLLKSI
jgi:hypothetical protein